MKKIEQITKKNRINSKIKYKHRTEVETHRIEI